MFVSFSSNLPSFDFVHSLCNSSGSGLCHSLPTLPFLPPPLSITIVVRRRFVASDTRSRASPRRCPPVPPVLTRRDIRHPQSRLSHICLSPSSLFPDPRRRFAPNWFVIPRQLEMMRFFFQCFLQLFPLPHPPIIKRGPRGKVTQNWGR